MFKKAITLVKAHPAFTGVVFVLGGVAALTIGAFASLLSPAVGAVQTVKSKVSGTPAA
jgi:hypothetical protein